MGGLILLTAAGGLLVSVIWLGRDPRDLLSQALLRPALLALMALLLLLLVHGSSPAWAYTLVATAAATGLAESYLGVYNLLSAPARRTTQAEQVRICAAWLVNALANLILLNTAAALAFPETFRTFGQPSPPVDVAYFTLLTFASGGYGDVLPATPLGKALAMVTSLSGLTYATILLAALFQRLRAD